MKKNITSVDEYIHGFPKEVQELLKQMRNTIVSAAPKAVEGIFLWNAGL
jgi:hypothetical protein